MRVGCGQGRASGGTEGGGAFRLVGSSGRCGDSPLVTVPSWGTEADSVSPGITKHRLLPWELRWGREFQGGRELWGNKRGGRAESSVMWAESGPGALSGAQIRVPGAEDGQGFAAASQQHCLVAANPRHNSELGTIPARVRGEGTFAPGGTNSCLVSGQSRFSEAVAAVAQCGLRGPGGACSPATLDRSLNLLDLHFLVWESRDHT